MELAQSVFANLLSAIGFGLVVALAVKAFQMATALDEIREILGDIRRNTQDHAQVTPIVPHSYSASGEELLRVIHSEEKVEITD